jgi:transglutaminase-like putative cysteine protease
VLAGLAALTLQIVRSEAGGQALWSVLPTLLAASATLGIWLARNAAPHRWDPWVSRIPIAFGASTLLLAGVLRAAGWYGEPIELIMLAVFQNVVLGLAGFARRERCRRCAALSSVFLVLFATAMTSNRAAFVAAACYAIAGLWWLMGGYWDRLQETFAAASSHRCVPARTAAILVTVLAALSIAAIVGATGTTTRALNGFMPASGGNRWNDPYARSGVGDGDNLIAARDEALSFGPVESELFLESQMPSLYDVADDLYGAPQKASRRHDRTIAIAAQKAGEEKQHTAQASRSGREFSAVRRRVRRGSETPPDRTAPALLYFVGRTPQHLAVERHDVFDGREWRQSGMPGRLPTPQLDLAAAKPWIRVRRESASPLFRDEDPGALKIINLRTNRIPAPPQLAAVHIDKLDREDFFGWTDDGVFCMTDREYIPQLTVIHLRSLNVNLEPLRAEGDFADLIRGSPGMSGSADPALRREAEAIALCLRVPEASAAVQETARRWTEDTPRGWLQVEAVVARLRREFSHDESAVVPRDCPDAATHFLHAGRGPDYLFATTAAVLLRSLGYPARLVSGFYARPERFDRNAGQTAVLKEDLHVWTEVAVGGSLWIPIEPTPGFEPPPVSMTWRQRMMHVARALMIYAARHRLAFLAAGLAIAAIVWQRQRSSDLALWSCWWIVCRGSPEHRVIWTLRLLEWRARLAGRARPAHITLERWYAPLIAAEIGAGRSAVRDFFDFVAQTLYSPRGVRHSCSPTDDRSVPRACRTVADCCSAARLRNTLRDHAASSPPSLVQSLNCRPSMESKFNLVQGNAI